ncbi:MAG: TPM domain-containing protein [Lachnospiraceae bacterium]|nr:TPM domain-containing protein [Lachnospiraceae bacterium]
MARSMGGGGSRGGGGRSMGGGSRSGSRSFSGGGRSRGSSSSRPRSMSGSGGGYRSSGYHSGGHHHHHYYHNSYSRPYRRTYGRSSGGGCSSILAVMIIMIVILFAMAGNFGGSSSSTSNKKLNRDKYNGAVDSSQGYYEDTCVEKFIDKSNESELISGFKNFYSKTGVFPFLYVIENTPAKSEYKGYDTYQDMLYEKLFDAEGNFLILYIAEEDDYYFAAGYDTGEIIDEESLDVICDKVNSYWYTGNLATAFGDGLEDAAKNIMAKSNASTIIKIIAIGIIVIIVISILFKWWKAKKAQENKEQENLEKILDTPLETFGNDISELTKKYDEQ